MHNIAQTHALKQGSGKTSKQKRVTTSYPYSLDIVIQSLKCSRFCTESHKAQNPCVHTCFTARQYKSSLLHVRLKRFIVWHSAIVSTWHIWLSLDAFVCLHRSFLFNPRQLAQRHHNLFLLRRCTLGWRQSARESLSTKEASADQLYQHFLLRRSLSCWERVCIHAHTHTHTQAWLVNQNCSLLRLLPVT